VGAPEDEIVLGSVAGVFGFRGEVRLMLHHREGETLQQERPVTLVGPEGERREVRLRVRPGAGKRVLGTISGVHSEEDARALQGWAIVIRRDELPEPEAGEFYVHALLDLPVRDEQGAEQGVIVDIIAGAVDIWVLETDSGEQRFFVATKASVLKVDLEAGRVIVRDGSVTAGE